MIFLGDHIHADAAALAVISAPLNSRSSEGACRNMPKADVLLENRQVSAHRDSRLQDGHSACLGLRLDPAAGPVAQPPAVGSEASEASPWRISYGPPCSTCWHLAPIAASQTIINKIRMCLDQHKYVGMAGFEPAASCSQSRRANQAAPHPVKPAEAYPVRSAHDGHQVSPAPRAPAAARERYATVWRPSRCAGVAQW